MVANTQQNIESPNSCLNSPLTSVGIQTLNEELEAQMLCWSWAFGCKTLNLPKGPSGNDSREVFYACITPLGVYPMEENLPWSSAAFLLSLTGFLKKYKVSFFRETFITNKLKGCPRPGEGVKLRTLAIETDDPALQCQEATANSLTHKNNFIFLGRGSLLPLLFLCFSAGVPDPCAEQRDEAGFPELRRGGQGGWSGLSTPEIWLCSQSQSPAPLTCYCPTYLRFGRPGEDVLIRGASLLIC